jgi:hypothetical protein
MRVFADGRRALHDERADSDVTLAYSLVAGFVALGVGAVTSFAASSEGGKLVLWSVVTAVTATAAGAARDSRWVRELSRSVADWIRSAQGL